LRCEWGVHNALFYVAKDPDAREPNGILGVSMWLPPKPASEPESWPSFLSSYLLWLKQGLLNIRNVGRGGLVYRRYQIWKRSQAEMQKEIWTDPHGYYFCNIVVVDPGVQGKGMGRKLMEVVTDQADREGRRCYLESSRKEPNVKIYERMGFKVVRRMTCEDEGVKCDLYCMVRDPILNAES
jgi:GNAT superfamily N-acetyltransferase